MPAQPSRCRHLAQRKPAVAQLPPTRATQARAGRLPGGGSGAGPRRKAAAEQIASKAAADRAKLRTVGSSIDTDMTDDPAGLIKFGAKPKA